MLRIHLLLIEIIALVLLSCFAPLFGSNESAACAKSERKHASDDLSPTDLNAMQTSTKIRIILKTRINSDSVHEADGFSARTASEVTIIQNRKKVLVPAGSTLRGRMGTGGRVPDGSIVLGLDSLSTNIGKIRLWNVSLVSHDGLIDIHRGAKKFSLRCVGGSGLISGGSICHACGVGLPGFNAAMYNKSRLTGAILTGESGESVDLRSGDSLELEVGPQESELGIPIM